MSDRPTCRNCVYWEQAGARLANAIVDPSAHADMGVCVFNPPMVKEAPSFPFPISMFPEVHADRWCGGWEAPADDGGGGERQPQNVVPFNRRVA